MEGGDDPDCRRGMIWDENRQDKELLEYYKNWISIHKKLIPLQKGSTKFENVDNEKNTFEIVREYNNQKIRVLVNLKKYEVKIID